MFEQLGLEGWTPLGASLAAGLAIGLAFGALAQPSRFCLRRAIAGPVAERPAALATWLTALATAVLGTQALIASGLVDFGGHRFLAAELPIAAILAGGLLFGVGMVLARGCISRLTVLGAGGNLRAITVILVFALVAHMTLKGVLSPLRVALGSSTLPLEPLALVTLVPGGRWVVAGALTIVIMLFAARSNAPRLHIVLAALLGLLVPLGWFATGQLLADDFDPIPLESLSFTLPHAETLFWSIASTSIRPGFGVGLVGGVLAGSLLLHLLRGEFRLQGFGTPRETLRYVAGASLMGIGGVLAGGCTIGAGLAGTSTLGLAGFTALGAIAAGGALASRFVDRDLKSIDPVFESATFSPASPRETLESVECSIPARIRTAVPS